MLDGLTSLQVIDQHLVDSQAALDSANNRMDRLGHRMDELRRKTTDQYRNLARERLDDLSAKHVIGRLDKTDHAALSLLNQKKAATEELETDIAQGVNSMPLT